MSLWPVDDWATAALVASFYAQLSKGIPRGEARRQVQLAGLAGDPLPVTRIRLRRGVSLRTGAPVDRTHPYFWSSFILAGDTGPLETAFVETAELTLSFAGSVEPILVEKADIELVLNRPARAVELYESALPLARRRGDLALQARILRGLADGHQRGRHDRAVKYRERADALRSAVPREP